MPDFSEEFKKGFAKGIRKGFGIKTVELPPGFDEKPLAYQLAWIDQQIPLLEAEVAALEARPRRQIGAAAARADDFDDLLKNFIQDLKENPKNVALDAMREQLLEFRARRAAMVAGMPQQLAPPAPKPTGAEIRTQKLAEITALEKEKATALSTMKAITNDQNILQGIERSYDDKIQKVVDTL